MRPDGVDIKFTGWDLIDFGNYKPSRLTTLSAVASTARSMGDLEVCEAVTAQMKEQYPWSITDGVLQIPGASVGANIGILNVLTARPNALHDMVRIGLPKAWLSGPVLTTAPYPAVLVAKAVSDGTALQLVLRPGTTPGRHTIGLGLLRPHTLYRVDGAIETTLLPDETGAANITVELDERTLINAESVCKEIRGRRRPVPRPYPGDDLITEDDAPLGVMAIEIDAPTDEVWALVNQIGQDKAGFYSFSIFERCVHFLIHNTYSPQARWQHTKAGDWCFFVEALPGNRTRLQVRGKGWGAISPGGKLKALLVAGLMWGWSSKVMQTRMLEGIKYTAEGRHFIKI